MRAVDKVHGGKLNIIHLPLRDRIGHEVREPAHLGVVGRERGIVGGSLFGRERRVRVVVHGHGAREEIHECGVCRRKAGYRHAVCRGVVLIGGVCLLNLREAVSQGCLLLARDHAVGGHLPQPHLAVVHQLPVCGRCGFLLPLVGIGYIDGRFERCPGPGRAEPYVVHRVGHGGRRRPEEYPRLRPGQPEGLARRGDGCGASAVGDAHPLVGVVLEGELVALVGRLAIDRGLAVVVVSDMPFALGVRGPLVRRVVRKRRNLFAAPRDDRPVDLGLQVGEDRLIDVVHDPLQLLRELQGSLRGGVHGREHVFVRLLQACPESPVGVVE